MDKFKESDIVNERIDYRVAEFFLNQNIDGITKIIVKTPDMGYRSVDFRDANDCIINVTREQYKKYSQLWTL
jgi:hypothetical protein